MAFNYDSLEDNIGEDGHVLKAQVTPRINIKTLSLITLSCVVDLTGAIRGNKPLVWVTSLANGHAQQ